MQIKIARIEEDFSISEFADENWESTEEISIENYWSGELAPVGRHFKAKLLWSDAALYVHFEAVQTEPLFISGVTNSPDTKTDGLWNSDVCEIFVAPNLDEPNRYYEFEIAPNGEWLDLAIEQLPEKRETDFEYASGMRAAAKIKINKVIMAIKVEWWAFGKTPRANDVWRGNLFRCVGSGARRGYLAWQPTLTTVPNFHVPERFGEFRFVK